MSQCGCCKGKVCKYKIIFRVYIANAYDLDINDYIDPNKCIQNVGSNYNPSVECECDNVYYQYSIDTSLVGCGVVRPIPNPNNFIMPDISCVKENKLDKLHFVYNFEDYTYPAPKIELLDIFINDKLETTDKFAYIGQSGQKFKTYRKNNCAYSSTITSKIKYDYYRGSSSTLNAKIINPKTGTDTNPDFKIKGFTFTSIGDLGYMFLNSKEKFKANIKFYNDDGTVYNTINPPSADPNLCNSENNIYNIQFDYFDGQYIIEDQIEADLNLLDNDEELIYSKDQKIFIYPIIVTYTGGKYIPTGAGGGTLRLKTGLISATSCGTEGSDLVNPLIISADKIAQNFEIDSSIEINDELKYCGQRKNALTVSQYKEYDCNSHSIVITNLCRREDRSEITKFPNLLMSAIPSFKYNIAIRYTFRDPIYGTVIKVMDVPVIPINSVLASSELFIKYNADTVVKKTTKSHEKIPLITSEMYEVCNNNKIDTTNDLGEIPVNGITSNNSYKTSSTNSELIAIPTYCVLTKCPQTSFTTVHDQVQPNTIGMYYNMSCSLNGMITSYPSITCSNINYDITKLYGQQAFTITYSLTDAYGDGLPPYNPFGGDYSTEILLNGASYGSDFAITDFGLCQYTLGMLFA